MLSLGFYNAHYTDDPAYIKWYDTEKGNSEVLGEKPFPVPISPSNISPRIALDRTLTYALRGLHLTI
jgi:hypothetical protein